MTKYKVLILPEGRCITYGEAKLSISNKQLSNEIDANEEAISFLTKQNNHISKYYNRQYKKLLELRVALGNRALEEATFISRKKAEKGLAFYLEHCKKPYKICEFDFLPQD